MATFLTAAQTVTYTLAAEEDLVLASGVTLTSNGSGFAVAAGENSGHILAIHGQVLANNTALNLARTSNTLPFSNAVSVGPGGIVQSLNSDGLVTNSNLIRITNHGLIETVSTATSSQGLDLFANTVIVNAGTISAFASDAIRVSPTAFADSTGPQRLDNSGQITGGANGLNYANMWLDGANSGVITGVSNGILVSGTLGLMTFSNSGRIGGAGTAITSSVGDDLLRNSGIVDGGVKLGGGADIYLGSGSGLVNGRIEGQAGNDTLDGSGASDDLDGGDDGDLLVGDGGDDFLLGQNGADLLRGGGGDDEMSGGAEADLLRGGDGDDTLDAGDGTDRIAGGGGGDLFRFASASDIGLGANGDVVLDFQTGLDLIDLSALGATAFIGKNAFGLVAGEVRYQRPTGTLSGDMNGDGIADWSMLLANNSALTAADLIL